MGVYNSSKTYVAPAFDAISQSGYYLKHFVGMLNAKVSRGGRRIPTRGVDWDGAQWFYDSVAHSDRKEVMRKSPIAFLQYCVMHPERLDERKLTGVRTEKVKKLRTAVFDSSQARALAVEQLDTVYRFGDPGMSYYAFEDKTQPDVCIKTNKFYLLVEGKRTEGDLTQSTDWVKERDQLVRHIDAFLDNTDGEYGGSLPVFGLEIVVASEAGKYNFASYENDANFDVWLPHRSKTMRHLVKNDLLLKHMTWEELQEGFKGIVDWQYIERLEKPREDLSR